MYHISPKLYFDRLNLWNIFQVNSFSISIILSAVSHKFCLDQNASRLYSFRYCLSPFEFERNLCPQGSRLKLLRKPTHNREDRLPFNRNTANMALKPKPVYVILEMIIVAFFRNTTVADNVCQRRIGIK